MKNLKTIIALLLAVLMAFSLAACGEDKDDGGSDSKASATQSDTAADDTTADSTAADATTADTTTADNTTEKATVSDNGGSTKSKSGKSDTPSNKSALDGKWKCALDIGKLAKKSAQSSMGSVADNQKAMYEKLFEAFDGLTMDMIMEFSANQKFSYNFDKNSAEKMIKKLKSNFKKVLPEAFAAMGISKEQMNQYLSQNGMTIDSFVEQYTKQFDVDSLFGTQKTSLSGTYRVDGNKMYLTEDGKKESTSEYAVFELKGNTLTITDLVGVNNSETILTSDMLPWVFKRV